MSNSRHRFVSLQRIAALSLAITVFAAPIAAAQSPEFRQSLAGIAASIGKDVSVTAKDGSQHKGTLTSLSTTEVVLVQSGKSLRLPLAEVREVRRGSHALRKGTLIGLLSGAGFGLVVCAADGCTADEGDETGLSVLLFSGIGAGAGAAVGAAIRASSASSRTIYRAPGKTTIALAPALGRKTVGLTGQIRW